MKWKRKHTLAKRAGNSHFDRKYGLRKFHAAGLARINLRVEQKLSQTDQLSIFSTNSAISLNISASCKREYPIESPSTIISSKEAPISSGRENSGRPRDALSRARRLSVPSLTPSTPSTPGNRADANRPYAGSAAALRFFLNCNSAAPEPSFAA